MGFNCTYVAAFASREETNKDQIGFDMKVSTLRKRVADLLVEFVLEIGNVSCI